MQIIRMQNILNKITNGGRETNISKKLNVILHFNLLNKYFIKIHL